MLQASKLLQPLRSSTKPRLQSPPIPTRICCKLSRRELAIFANSSLLLAGSEVILPGNSTGEVEEKAQVPVQDDFIPTLEKNKDEENVIESEEIAIEAPQESISRCIDGSKPPSKRAFMDISIDREPVGRIVIGIYENSAPFGASRFTDLLSGKSGISYKRKEFIKIMPNYVQHGGVRSYGVDAELAKRTGKDLKNDALKLEWERAMSECPAPRNLEGSVSIIVRDPSKPPPKTKLVARGGKLQIDEEEVGVEPNGTQFVICTKNSPELDDSALVIGRVLEGMDVLQTIAQVKTVQENSTSPYFRVAKLIGDKRAVVAERGFNRPYSKILVTNCGLLE